ncbi:MAG: hypothetical protein ACE37H_07230 [Phycisphaeraceae bacterium]
MTRVDLTPNTYLNRCRSRAVLRRWLAVLALCLLVTAVSVGLASTGRPDHASALTREGVAQAEARRVQNQALATTLETRLKQLERELQAGEHLTRRPDWSAVLDRVAAQFQGEMVMTGFRLGPITDSKVRTVLGPVAADAPQGSVWLILTGVAAANSDVPGLILRLESLGLFDQVVMTGTQRETFAGAARTGFVMACRVQ